MRTMLHKSEIPSAGIKSFSRTSTLEKTTLRPSAAGFCVSLCIESSTLEVLRTCCLALVLGHSRALLTDKCAAIHSASWAAVPELSCTLVWRLPERTAATVSRREMVARILGKAVAGVRPALVAVNAVWEVTLRVGVLLVR